MKPGKLLAIVIVILLAVWIPQYAASWSLYNSQSEACVRSNIIRGDLNSRGQELRDYYAAVISNGDVPPKVRSAARAVRYGLTDIPDINCDEAVSKFFPLNILK